MRRVFQPLLAVAAVAWAVLVVAAPHLAATSRGDDSRLRFATAAYVTGSAICHQRPERSFHLRSLPLPVCARCTGIYAGAALGVISASIGFGAGRRIPWWRRAVLLASVPMALSFAAEWATPIPVSNTARALTGIVAGAVVAAFAIRAPDIH